MPKEYNIRTLRSLKKNIELKISNVGHDSETLRGTNKSLDKQIAELELKESYLASNLLAELREQKEKNTIKIEKCCKEIMKSF